MGLLRPPARCLAIRQSPGNAQLPLIRGGKLATVGNVEPRAASNDRRVLPVFVPIQAGTFLMGSPESEDGRGGNEVLHEVTLTRDFEIADTPVTQAQYEAVMGSNPSLFSGSGFDAPVEQVSWEDAVAFCEKLSAEDPDWTYRLPTEAEWEYACRAGTSGPYNVDGASLDELGWHDGNAGWKTHPVREKRPNAWGLHDCHGNVFEWCQDWYTVHLGDSAVTDPQGPEGGDDRVLRGGSWSRYARACRSASRIRYDPGLRDSCIGFRPVRMKKAEGTALEPEPQAGDRSRDDGTDPRFQLMELEVGLGDGAEVGDEVQFTTYRPKEIVVGKEETMLVYAHLRDQTDDAFERGEKHPLEQVEDDARKALGANYAKALRTSKNPTGTLPKGGVVKVLPWVEGIDFDPPEDYFVWSDAVKYRRDFTLRARSECAGGILKGRLTFFLNGVIFAVEDLRFRIVGPGKGGGAETSGRERGSARRVAVFASYSHKDEGIVELVESCYKSTGGRYIRDRNSLRTGDPWQKRLYELIEDADIFQLFWSPNSAESEFVEREWRHALRVQDSGREGFIRGTYWGTKGPQPNPPDELCEFHFEPLDVPVPAPAPSPPPSGVPPARSEPPPPPSSPRPLPKATVKLQRTGPLPEAVPTTVPRPPSSAACPPAYEEEYEEEPARGASWGVMSHAIIILAVICGGGFLIWVYRAELVEFLLRVFVQQGARSVGTGG